MNLQDPDNLKFYFGKRNEEFKEMIKNVLKLGRIKEHYLNELLDDDSMREYARAFTSITTTNRINKTTGKIEKDDNSEDNYEVYEKLGDGVFDNFIGWYAYRRFGEDNSSKNVKVLHIIRSKYGSKNIFAPLGEELGFWDFISSSVYERNHSKKPLLEDVFEAFLGATSYLLDKKFMNGVGYAICYDILKNIFDKIEITTEFEEMLDYVSKLNQLTLKFKQLGKIIYKDERMGNMTFVKVLQERPSYGIYQIATGQAMIKKDAKQNAAKNAYKYFENLGFKL